MNKYNKNRCSVGDFARLFSVSSETVEAWWSGKVTPPFYVLMFMEHWSDVVPLLNDTLPKFEHLCEIMAVVRNVDNRERAGKKLIRARYLKCKKAKQPVSVMEEFYHTHYYSNAKLAKLLNTSTSQVERWRYGKIQLPFHVLDFINNQNHDDHRLTDEHLEMLKKAKGIEPTSFL